MAAGKMLFQHKKDFVLEEEIIGSGGFAEVRKAKLTSDGKTVAAKVFTGGHRKRRDLKLLQRESSILNGIEKHRNVTELIGICLSPLVLLLEYVEGVDLSEVIYADEGDLSDDSSSTSSSAVHLDISPWNVRLEIACQIACGMQHLHSSSPSIVHLDLKPGNVLLKIRGNQLVCCKVTDFGLSKTKEMSLSSQSSLSQGRGLPGTLLYTSPERFKESGVMQDIEKSKRADVYSFGVILWELQERKSPAGGENVHVVQVKILFGNAIPNAEQQAPSGYEKVRCNCCEEDPLLRPKFADIQRNLEAICQKSNPVSGENLPPNASRVSVANALEDARNQSDDCGDTLPQDTSLTVVKFNAAYSEFRSSLFQCRVFLLAFDRSSGQWVKTIELKQQHAIKYQTSGFQGGSSIWRMLSAEDSFLSVTMRKGLQYQYLILRQHEELFQFKTIQEFIGRRHFSQFYVLQSSADSLIKYDVIESGMESFYLRGRFNEHLAEAVVFFVPNLQRLNFKIRADFERQGFAESVITETGEVLKSIFAGCLPKGGLLFTQPDEIAVVMEVIRLLKCLWTSSKPLAFQSAGKSRSISAVPLSSALAFALLLAENRGTKDYEVSFLSEFLLYLQIYPNKNRSFCDYDAAVKHFIDGQRLRNAVGDLIARASLQPLPFVFPEPFFRSPRAPLDWAGSWMFVIPFWHFLCGTIGSFESCRESSLPGSTLQDWWGLGGLKIDVGKGISTKETLQKMSERVDLFLADPLLARSLFFVGDLSLLDCIVKRFASPMDALETLAKRMNDEVNFEVSSACQLLNHFDQVWMLETASSTDQVERSFAAIGDIFMLLFKSSKAARLGLTLDKHREVVGAHIASLKLFADYVCILRSSRSSSSRDDSELDELQVTVDRLTENFIRDRIVPLIESTDFYLDKNDAVAQFKAFVNVSMMISLISDVSSSISFVKCEMLVFQYLQNADLAVTIKLLAFSKSSGFSQNVCGKIEARIENCFRKISNYSLDEFTDAYFNNDLSKPEFIFHLKSPKRPLIHEFSIGRLSHTWPLISDRKEVPAKTEVTSLSLTKEALRELEGLTSFEDAESSWMFKGNYFCSIDHPDLRKFLMLDAMALRYLLCRDFRDNFSCADINDNTRGSFVGYSASFFDRLCGPSTQIRAVAVRLGLTNLFIFFYDMPQRFKSWLVALNRFKSSKLFDKQCKEQSSEIQSYQTLGCAVDGVGVPALEALCHTIMGEGLSIAGVALTFADLLSDPVYKLEEEIETLRFMEDGFRHACHPPVAEWIISAKWSILEACKLMQLDPAVSALRQLTFDCRFPTFSFLQHFHRGTREAIIRQPRVVNTTLGHKEPSFVYFLATVDYKGFLSTDNTIINLIATEKHCAILNKFVVEKKLIEWIKNKLKDWKIMDAFVQKSKKMYLSHSSLLEEFYTCCRSFSGLLFQSIRDFPSLVIECEKMCKDVEKKPGIFEQWANCSSEKSLKFFQEAILMIDQH